MDNYEAFQILQTKYHIDGPIKEVCKELEAREAAVVALEKQIPVKTKVNVRGEDIRIGSVIFRAGTKVHYCPKCNTPVTGTYRYCCNCGQALIW